MSLKQLGLSAAFIVTFMISGAPAHAIRCLAGPEQGEYIQETILFTGEVVEVRRGIIGHMIDSLERLFGPTIFSVFYPPDRVHFEIHEIGHGPAMDEVWVTHPRSLQIAPPLGPFEVGDVVTMRAEESESGYQTMGTCNVTWQYRAPRR